MDNETVVNGCDFRFVISDIDDDTVQTVSCVKLGHGSFEDAETGDIESFEKDLTYTFVGLTRNTWSG